MSRQSQTPKRPTLGQRTQLQRLCRVGEWALVGTRAAGDAGPPTYELRERAALGGWARVVHPVHPRMVAQLTAAGWIERAGGDAREWWYRITLSGIEAAHAPPVGADGGKASNE